MREIARDAIAAIMRARSISELAEEFGAIEHGKRTKRINAKEYDALVQLGIKKEKLLRAQGYR